MIRSIIMARRGSGLLAVGALVVLLGADEGDCTGSPQINNTVIVCASANGGGTCENEAKNSVSEPPDPVDTRVREALALYDAATMNRIAQANKRMLQRIAVPQPPERLQADTEIAPGLTVYAWQPPSAQEATPSTCFCEVDE